MMSLDYFDAWMALRSENAKLCSTIETLKTENAKLRKQLPECAAGPWQPIAELTVFDRRQILIWDWREFIDSIAANPGIDIRRPGTQFFAETKRPMPEEEEED